MTSSVVYGLYDPRSGELRYVGKTVGNLSARLKGHLHDAALRRSKTRCGCWIRELASVELMPVALVLEHAPRQQLGSRECAWIAWARERSDHLTNLTAGGDGGALGWKPSMETLERMKRRPNVWKGRRHTPESLERMSVAQRAKWTPERREVMARRHRGKSISKAHRERCSRASKDMWADADFRRRMASVRAASEAVRDGRRRASLARRGRKRSQSAVDATAAACRKPVVDQYGRVYPSHSAAAIAVGVDIANIGHVIAGRRPHVKGYVFTSLSPAQAAGGR